MIKITESMHYEIYKEYEVVLLKIKASKKIVTIGDFYGDVKKAVISPEENYCIMVGCGIIVYFLHEPFIPYEYDKKCKQWEEWYRSGDIWIEDVMLENEEIIVIQMENGERNKIHTHSSLQ